jgi:hypothetical protein
MVNGLIRLRQRLPHDRDPGRRGDTHSHRVHLSFGRANGLLVRRLHEHLLYALVVRYGQQRSRDVWPRLKRWRTFLVRPFLRLTGPRLREIHYRYEKTGVEVADEPIPWNAEAVLVEALLRFAPDIVPNKNDFQLRMPDRVPRMAVALHCETEEGAVRVVFRLPPIQSQTPAAIHYQGSMLGQVTLPFLSADSFFQGLCLRWPSIFARLGKYNVACQTLTQGQFCGLSAGAILVSPTSLVPLSDYHLRVEFVDRATGCTENTLMPLSGAQLLRKEASLSVVLPPWPQRVGSCCLRWLLGDRLLAHCELRVISPAAFQQSLYLAVGRFLAQGKDGAALYRYHSFDGLAFAKHPLPERGEARAEKGPASEVTKGMRPCFLIASREPGMAGLCALEVRVQFRDPNYRPQAIKDEIMATDRPSLFVPDLTPIADLQQVRSYELFSKGQFLGALQVSPTPAAAFTGEGGFRAAADFDWTPFNEDELFDRLEKLMEAAEGERGQWFVVSAADVAHDFNIRSPQWRTL